MYTRGRMSRKSLSETLYRARAIRARARNNVCAAFIGANAYVRYVLDVSIITSVNRRAFSPSSVAFYLDLRHRDRGGPRANENRFSRKMDFDIAFSTVEFNEYTRLEFRGGERKRIRKIISESRIFDERILHTYPIISRYMIANYIYFFNEKNVCSTRPFLRDDAPERL